VELKSRKAVFMYIGPQSRDMTGMITDPISGRSIFDIWWLNNMYYGELSVFSFVTVWSIVCAR